MWKQTERRGMDEYDAEYQTDERHDHRIAEPTALPRLGVDAMLPPAPVYDVGQADTVRSNQGHPGSILTDGSRGQELKPTQFDHGCGKQTERQINQGMANGHHC